MMFRILVDIVLQQLYPEEHNT